MERTSIERIAAPDARLTIQNRISWLRACAASLRLAPATWPYAWPLVGLWEAEADALERGLAPQQAPLRAAAATAPAPADNVVFLADWRRHSARA
jgi:hypothetical protein